MRKLTRNTLVAAAVMATAVGMTATPALAATWTITNGGAITATNIGDLGAITSRGTVVTCTTGSGAGTLDSPTSPDDTVGALTSLTLSGNSTVPSDPRCISSPGGIFIAITVNASAGNPFPVSVNPSGAGTTVNGTIGNVTASFSGSDGCSGQITAPGGGPGVVRGQYNNSTGVLSADPTDLSLEVSSLSGTCDPDLVVLGDTVALAGDFNVRHGTAIPTITTP